MKRLIAIVFILLLGVSIPFAQDDSTLPIKMLGKDCVALLATISPSYTVGGGSVSCTNCNSGNAGTITQTTTTINGSDYYQYVAWQFTTTKTECITGGYFNCEYVTTPAGATYEIWTDSSGSPGSIVGAGYTSTVNPLPSSLTNVAFNFAATQTLAAGTYWVVWHALASSAYYGYNTAGGGSGWKYSSDGSTWSASSYNRQTGVYGCDQS